MSRHRTGLFLYEGGFQAVVDRYLEILGIHERHTCKIAKRSRGANALSESFRPLNRDGPFPGSVWSSANKKSLETTTVGNIWGLWSDAVRSTKSLTLWLDKVSLSHRWLFISNKLVILLFKTLFSTVYGGWIYEQQKSWTCPSYGLEDHVLQTVRSTSVESTINIST